MAKRTEQAKPVTSKKVKADSGLYLCCFSMDEFGDTEYTGSFQIVVEGKDPEDAAQICKKKLRQLRDSKKFFSDPTSIYLESIIQLRGSFKSGLLVNFENGPTDDACWKITCPIPEQKDHEAESYGIKGDSEGGTVDPFVDFGGQAASKAALGKSAVASSEAKSLRGESKMSAGGKATGATNLAKASDEARAKAREAKLAGQNRKASLAATLAEFNGTRAPRALK